MADMTISQALRRIKKITGQIGEHRSRATTSVVHLAEQTPAYTFVAVAEQAKTAVAELLMLQTAVAVANATTVIEVEGQKAPLAFAVRLLREIASEIAWLKALPVKAQDKVIEQEARYDYESSKHVTDSKTYVCALPEAKRDERVRALQDRFDKINDLVETTNHKTSFAVSAT